MSGTRSNRRWLRFALIAAAVLVLAGFGLWGRFPDPREFVAAVTGADPAWLALAVALQAVSIGAFSWQQQQLLQALGVRLRAGFVLAVTLARTCLLYTSPSPRDQRGSRMPSSA